MTFNDIPSSEIVLIDPAKLSAAADVLYKKHGYKAYDRSLLTLALYEWVAEEVERMVNNAVEIVTCDLLHRARFTSWVRYLSDKKHREWAMSVKPKAERRGVGVVT